MLWAFPSKRTLFLPLVLTFVPMEWAFPEQGNTFVNSLPNFYVHVMGLPPAYCAKFVQSSLYNNMRVIHKVPQIGGTGPQFCQDWAPNQKVRMKTIDIRVIRKVRNTQHQNPEFGHTWRDSTKNLRKSTLAFKGGWNSENNQFWW